MLTEHFAHRNSILFNLLIKIYSQILYPLKIPKYECPKNKLAKIANVFQCNQMQVAQ